MPKDSEPRDAGINNDLKKGVKFFVATATKEPAMRAIKPIKHVLK